MGCCCNVADVAVHPLPPAASTGAALQRDDAALAHESMRTIAHSALLCVVHHLSLLSSLPMMRLSPPPKLASTESSGGLFGLNHDSGDACTLTSLKLST